VDGLRAAARAKARDTRRRAEAALERLVAAGRPVNFKAVAAEASCSTAWLYGQDDIKQRIAHLRARSAARPAAVIPPRERASEASKDAVIAALRKRVTALQDENATLRQQLEVVYGELATRGGADNG
jgi:hypothetical protein